MPVTLVLPENVSLLNPNQNVSIALKADQSEQKTVIAPVIFTDHSNDGVKNAVPSEIKVTVVGKSEAIKTLKNGDLTVNVNSQEISEAGSVVIETQDISVPTGLDIINFEPTEIRLETTPS
jgi:hypothetical protein